MPCSSTVGIIILLAALTAMGQPKTLRVPQDHLFVQSAVDAAADGDTVLIAEGSHNANVRLSKRIVLGSYYLRDHDTTHISRTILDGSWTANPDSGSVILVLPGTDTTTVIAGLTIFGGVGTRVVDPGDGSIWVGGGGINIVGGGARVTRNIITGNNLLTSRGPYGAGIAIYPMAGPLTRWIIERNQITHNTIVATSTVACEGAGIWATGTGRIVENVISGNRVSATGASARAGGIQIIASDSTDRVEVSGNIITGNEVTGTVSSLGAALSVWALYANLRIDISGNLFTDNAATRPATASPNGGVLFFYADAAKTLDVFFANNVIAKNNAPRMASISVRNGRYQFVHNTVADNVDSTTLRVQTGSTSVMFNLLNSILWNPRSSDEIEGDSLITVHHSLVRGGQSGSHNLSLDPRFALGDPRYQLSDSSPAIGAGSAEEIMNGVVLVPPRVDHFGSSRPQPAGSPPDLGAVEQTLSQPTTHVNDAPILPAYGALDQNYPNPFNPETRIGYRIKERGWVKLSVMNILGQQVAVLVDEEKEAGYHETVFGRRSTVDRLPSGIYFYRISVSSVNGLPAAAKAGQRYEATRKMLMIQ